MQELFSDARTYLALAGLIGLVFAIGRWVGAAARGHQGTLPESPGQGHSQPRRLNCKGRL